jgi:hypothetical protein
MSPPALSSLNLSFSSRPMPPCAIPPRPPYPLHTCPPLPVLYHPVLSLPVFPILSRPVPPAQSCPTCLLPPCAVPPCPLSCNLVPACSPPLSRPRSQSSPSLSHLPVKNTQLPSYSAHSNPPLPTAPNLSQDNNFPLITHLTVHTLAHSSEAYTHPYP